MDREGPGCPGVVRAGQPQDLAPTLGPGTREGLEVGGRLRGSAGTHRLAATGC